MLIALIAFYISYRLWFSWSCFKTGLWYLSGQLLQSGAEWRTPGVPGTHTWRQIAVVAQSGENRVVEGT